MKSKKLIYSLCAGVIAFICFISVFSGIKIAAFADEVDETALEIAANDYVFTILPQDEVPMAAAPVKSFSFIPVAIIMTAIAISLIAYLYWFSYVRNNIRELAVLMTPYEKRSILDGNISFLHPIKLIETVKAAEFSVAGKFMNR